MCVEGETVKGATEGDKRGDGAGVEGGKRRCYWRLVRFLARMQEERLALCRTTSQVQAATRRAATYRICVERLVVDEHVCLWVPAWNAWGCATSSTGAAAPTAHASASSSTATAGHCTVYVCLGMLQGGARRRAEGVARDGGDESAAGGKKEGRCGGRAPILLWIGKIRWGRPRKVRRGARLRSSAPARPGLIPRLSTRRRMSCTKLDLQRSWLSTEPDILDYSRIEACNI